MGNQGVIVKNLIIIIGLTLSMQVFAQASEPGWKTQLRELVTKVAGAEWGVKIFGRAPVTESPLPMPEIPKQMKDSTDVETYGKVKKEPTEYDRLPADKKRQFDYRFVEELFLVTRKTEAKDEDLSTWLNTLDQGGSREGIYQALVLDEVYAAMEDMEERPTEKLLDFSLKFSQKYLNQTFNQETLAPLNLYSLKRILTEKSLDIMEYYEIHDLDALYRWYANFSGEIAQEHPALLASEIRQDPSVMYHYEWAKGMPLQHIKSEFIIKIHSVMNGLQQLQE
jgi:hypothetical protein